MNQKSFYFLKKNGKIANLLYNLKFGQSLINMRGIRQKRKFDAEFIADATTYADKHAAILDKHSIMPYDELDENLKLPHLTKKEVIALKTKEKFKQRFYLNLNFDHIPIINQMVLMFPGQGAQFVGMGNKVIDNPSSLRLFDQANEILGYNLLDICQKGPKTKLDQTLYCQVATFVSSMAAFEKFKVEKSECLENITEAAGFSIGEYCALVVGDVISFEDALKIIKIRAKEMHQCCQVSPSGMITVRVTAASNLEQAILDAKKKAKEDEENPVCDVANYLYCGVKVIGGTKSCLNYLKEKSNQYKIQIVKQLQVSGAFHTTLMRPAETKIAEVLNEIKVNQPRVNVYSNYTGKVYLRHPKHIKESIVKQISHPVKWEQIIQLLYRKHQDYKFPSYIEIGPGRNLGTILHQVSKKAYTNYITYSC